MKIYRPLPRAKTENVLPMINVVFLLLIFFMMAGAFQILDPFEIEPLTSRSDTSEDHLEGVVLIDSEGRLAFEGEEVERAALADAIAARLAEDPEAVVRLKADGRVSTPLVVRTMELMQGAGVKQLVLLALTPEN